MTRKKEKRTSHNDHIRIDLITLSNDCIWNIIHKIISIGWNSHQPITCKTSVGIHINLQAQEHQSEFTSTCKRSHSIDYYKRSRVNGWLGNQWGLFRSMISERSECGHTPKQGSWAQVWFDITHSNMRCHTYSHVLSSQHIQEAPSRPLRKTKKLPPLLTLFQVE